MEKKIFELYKNNIIQPLKGFCRVIEEGSIAAASEKYNISPGAFTKQIKCLEKQLGIELFDRGLGKKIVPNNIALRFYKESNNVIVQLENLIRKFSNNEKSQEEKTLKIGIAATFLSVCANYISRFKNLYGDEYNITIKSCKYDDGLKMIMNNELDIFISSFENNEKLNYDIQFIKLTDYKPYWLLWKGHPLANKKELTKNDIINTDLIFNRDSITIDSLRNFVDDYNLTSVVEIEDCGIDGIKHLIKNKLGIWLIFDIFLYKEDSENFVLKSAENLFPTGQYGCYLNKNFKKSKMDFMEFISKEDIN